MSQTEAVVAQFHELQDGQKPQVTLGDTDILLIRRNAIIYAIGADCTLASLAQPTSRKSGFWRSVNNSKQVLFSIKLASCK
jgi:hypothetical protein